MKTNIKRFVGVELKYLKVDAVVRYWQDGTINRERDNDCEEEPKKPQIPFAEYVGEENRTLRAYNWHWKPTIDIDSGRILGWPKGTSASIHYKVCDEFYCEILDANDNEVYAYDGYVPRCMCPKENGYGDYIIMDIDGCGFIQGWDSEHVLRILEQED